MDQEPGVANPRQIALTRRGLLAAGAGAAVLWLDRHPAAAQATPIAAPVTAHPDFRVRFIRHAESEINVLRTIDVPGAQLPPDSGVTFPLTQLGMEQAVALGEALRDDLILAIHTSSRLRCTQTADALGFTHRLPLALEPGLVEIAFTDPEASFSTVDWIAVTRTMTAWLLGDSDARAPGGESLTEVLERFLPPVQAAIDQYASQPGDLVFVSHSIVLSAALPALFADLSLAWTLLNVLPHTGIATGQFIDGALVCTDWNGSRPG